MNSTTDDTKKFYTVISQKSKKFQPIEANM